MGNDHAWPDFAKQLRHLFQCPFIVKDEKIVLFKAMVGRVNKGGGVRPFLTPDAADLLRPMESRATIARGHAGNVHLPLFVADQPNQGAAAQELGIVGMSQ